MVSVSKNQISMPLPRDSGTREAGGANYYLPTQIFRPNAIRHPWYLSFKLIRLLISAFFYRPIWMMPPLPGASRSNGWKCESSFTILHAKKGRERSQRPNVCWYWWTVNPSSAVVFLLKCIQVMIQVAQSSILSILWSFSI
jgi:hypothetical protein